MATGPLESGEAGDVLASIRAPVGPTNIAVLPCCIGRGLAAVRARSGTHQRYLLYFLRWQARNLAALGTGTTFAAVSGAQIRGMEVPLPPFEQQDQIVAATEQQLSRLKAAVQSPDSAEPPVPPLRRAIYR